MNSTSLMQMALDQARAAMVLSPPNPAVGCVIVHDGQVIGRGHTQRVGGHHAEIEAMIDADRRGHAVAGATAYVTLEPCSHHGRTPPCCDALIARGIMQVVIAQGDPNPQVSGRGIARLRAAGIDVVQIDPSDPAARTARELNLGFFSRMVRKLPWVRLKVAASIDGTTALADGRSQWITSPAAREDGHAWRARAGALLTGIGTVLADNPRLDVRLPDTPRQPPLAVVDSRLDTPPTAHLFAARRPVWIYTASDDPARRAALADRGAEVIVLPDAQGKVDLAAMMRDLAAGEVNELHVEAGFKLNGSLVRAGLVDEFLVYLAPKLLGPGMGMANLDALASLDQATALQFLSAEPIGPDLRILARIPGRDRF
jgi:diaminohydroxyphosphoribosylaminopyrimidine deaminase/5-amino-6-(5-phosphoribosylamino)uracil reductase